MNRLKLTASMIAIGGALSALGVAGCSPGGGANNTVAASAEPALPLTTADTPQSASAPMATNLPAAAPARVARLTDPRQRYAYADRAYRYARVLGEAPPDYTFDYGGVRPYVWDSNGAYRFAEPTSSGERTYYFDPGADEPYLVRDGRYAYGYDRGQLVVVYDEQGRVLDPSYVDQRLDVAGRYLARARALYDAARRSQRQAVALNNWEQRRAALDAERTRWEAEQREQADWRAYHDQNSGRDQAYWQAEQDRRAAEAERYNEATRQASVGGRTQRGRVDSPQNPVAVAAALAAAAAAYNAGRHDDRVQHQDRPQQPPPSGSRPAPPSGPQPPAPHAEPQAAQPPPQPAGDWRAQRHADQSARQAAQQQLGAQQQAAQQQAAQQQAAAAARAQVEQQRAQQDPARAAAEAQRNAARNQAQAQQEAARAAAEAQRNAARQAAPTSHPPHDNGGPPHQQPAAVRTAPPAAAVKPAPAPPPGKPAERRHEGEHNPAAAAQRGPLQGRVEKQEP